MNMDEQPTQPLFIVSGANTREHYRLLKRLSDLSGVRFLEVYLFSRGRKVSQERLPHLNRALYQVMQERGL